MIGCGKILLATAKKNRVVQKQMNPQGLFVSPFILSCSKYYKHEFLLVYLHGSIIKLACTQFIH